MKFELNPVEVKNAEDFKQMCYKIQEHLKVEAITFDYTFTPGSIGQSCSVHCNELNVGVNITDYSSW